MLEAFQERLRPSREIRVLRELADVVLDVLLTSGRDLPRALEILAEVYDEYNDAYVKVEPSPCADCGVDTTPEDGPWEYYMVHPGLWERATKDQPARYLCIGCLESRIGARLTPGDFTHARINDPNDGMSSERLRNRLGATL